MLPLLAAATALAATALFAQLPAKQPGQPQTEQQPGQPPKQPGAQGPQKQPGTNDQQIKRLIEQLGDADYFVRQRAQEELQNFSFEAFDALTAATTHEDLEIAARAKHLLRLLRVAWANPADPPQVQQFLRDYDGLDREKRIARMHALAVLPGELGLVALCRLARYEGPELSKYAALELLSHQKPGARTAKTVADRIRQQLRASTRPAVVWLLTWLRFQDDPKAALAAWAKLIEQEESLLRSSPEQTSPKFLVGLVRFQIGWLRHLGEKQQMVASMQRLIDLEKGDVATLTELSDWLIEQKLWKSVEELGAKFPARFATNAMLLYSLAQAQAAGGNQDLAEKTARQALAVPANKSFGDPRGASEARLAHWEAANKLRRRGLFAWARREYEELVTTSGAGSTMAQAAQLSLSEMLHDQGAEEDAAKVLQAAMAAHQKTQPAAEDVLNRSPLELRSRMNYFLACHFKSKNDPAQQREHLLLALGKEGDQAQEDSVDIDALIELKRAADLSDKQRERVERLIRRTKTELQNAVSGAPQDPNAYNQYAWLVGNTSKEEADLNQALRYSQKSIELSPDASSYYDTLAHVYAAKGDYENAVKHQTRAAELEPCSGLILRQLKVFQGKLEEQKKRN